MKKEKLTERGKLLPKRLTKNQIEKFIKIFNRNFSPPFLPKNFAYATLRVDESGEISIILQIGNRDVSFGTDLQEYGSGTWLSGGWDIKERETKPPARKRKKK